VCIVRVRFEMTIYIGAGGERGTHVKETTIEERKKMLSEALHLPRPRRSADAN
jgi:hypothetical protein